MNQMISSKHFDLSERPITRSSIALNKRGHVAEIARKGRIVIPMKSLYLHARGEQTSRLITAGLSQPVADGATAKLDHSRAFVFIKKAVSNSAAASGGLARKLGMPYTRQRVAASSRGGGPVLVIIATKEKVLDFTECARRARDLPRGTYHATFHFYFRWTAQARC
jgi:hypothetical protein